MAYSFMFGWIKILYKSSRCSISSMATLRRTQNIQGYIITLTTSQVQEATISQVQEAIKQSKNNNSQSPDKLNIRHLKHIGPLGLAFHMSMFKTALNKKHNTSHMEVG